MALGFRNGLVGLLLRVRVFSKYEADFQKCYMMGRLKQHAMDMYRCFALFCFWCSGFRFVL